MSRTSFPNIINTNATLISAQRRAAQIANELSALLDLINEAEVMEEDMTHETRESFEELSAELENIVDHDLVG